MAQNKMSDNFITLAKIGKPFGLKGFLKTQTYTDDLLRYPRLFLKTKKGWVPCNFESTEWKQKQLMVKFATINTPEAAQAYTNLLIGAPREALPTTTDKEYYWADLEGLSVITQDKVNLGTVLYLTDTGASDMMVVKGKTEILIPFIQDDIVLDVDLEKKTILVNWTTDFQ